MYPTETQIELLGQHFGSCRFVYNYFLRERINFYELNRGNGKQGITYNDTSKMLTKMKKDPEFVWLKFVNSQSLISSLRCLEVAYRNFFKKRAQFPKFKNKHDKQSFIVPQHFDVNIVDGFLDIPKFSPIKIIYHRPMEGEKKSITISKTKTDKYFASILCEVEQKYKPNKSGNFIGIDLGIKSFLVTSDGDVTEPPKFLRASEAKLKLLSRWLSRKIKGSKNRDKARKRVALLHEKIANQRKDFLHKLSHRLVDENQAIFVEDLNVKGMQANHHLAKSIADSGLSEFIRQLKYKSEWSGTTFSKIGRFMPSSKRCHNCGWINQSLTLQDREWTCQECGKLIDRDFNAAQNILQFGKQQLRADCPEVTLGERRCRKTPRRTKKPTTYVIG
jgi:putative transposase